MIMPHLPFEQKISIAVCYLIAFVTGFGCCIDVSIWDSVFTGPDRTLWIKPFLLTTAAISVLCGTFIFIQQRGAHEKNHLYTTLVVCVLFYATGIFLFCSIQRLHTGLRSLEAFNESMAIMVSRGYSLYPAENQSPTGTIYSPFFFLITGLLYRFMPFDIFFGKTISILSTLVTMRFCFLIGKQLYHKSTIALMCPALFILTYGVTHSLYDHTCTDSLLMLIMSASTFYFVKQTQSGDTLALFLAGLGCFTKQSGIILFLVLCIYSIVHKKYRTIGMLLIFWLFIGGITVAYYKPMALSYLIAYPSAHGFLPSIPLKLYSILFLKQFPLWIGVIYCFVKFVKTDNKNQSAFGRFFLIFTCICISSLLGIQKNGGWIFAFFPLEPLLCCGSVSLLISHKLLFILQLILGVYNPFAALYSKTTLKKSDEFITSVLINSPKEVWLPTQTYLYKKSNKKIWDNACALQNPTWAGKKISQELLSALKEKRFSHILLRQDTIDDFWMLHPSIHALIEKNYMKTVHGFVIVFTPQ